MGQGGVLAAIPPMDYIIYMGSDGAPILPANKSNSVEDIRCRGGGRSFP